MIGVGPGRLVLATLLACSVIAGCSPGMHGVSISNSLQEPVSLEVVRVGAERVDRTWAVIPAGGVQQSVISSEDPFQLAEARVRLNVSDPLSPCYIFQLPTYGLSYHELRMDGDHLKLEQLSSFGSPQVKFSWR